MPLRGRVSALRSAVVGCLLAAILLPPIFPDRPVHAASPPLATCHAPLILQLQPGERHVDGSVSGPIAADIPLDPVTIALPLYPDAQPGTQPVQALDVAGYDDPYQKSAAAEYLLPADRQTAVDWYTEAMASCGYRPAGLSQTSGNGVTAETRDFASPTISSALIALSFEDVPNSAGGTFLLASAAVVSHPLRARGSDLEGHYRSVDITYTTSGFNPPGKHLHIHLTVREPAMIEELALAVELPQEVDTVVHSCGGRDWNVTLVFHSHTGKAITANLKCGDLRIGSYPPLVDPYNETLLTVQKILLASCQTSACKLVGLA